MFKNKFLKNNFFYLGSVGLGGVLGYLFHFLISRQLSVGEYGELQSITSLSLIFGVFFSAFSYFTIKNSAVFSLHNDQAGQVHFLAFVKRKFKGAILGFLIFFLALLPVIKNLLHLGDYLGILIVGLTIIVSFYGALYNNSLQGWSDFIGLGSIGLAVISVKLVSGYFLALFSPNASAVAGSLLISALAGWLIARFYFRKKWPVNEVADQDSNWRDKYFSGTSFRKSFINIFIFSLGLALISNADIVIVKNVATAQIAGYYAALSVLGKTILWLNFSVASVLFPDACADGYSGKPANRKSIIGSYSLMLLISFPLIMLFRFFPNLLVGIMFGNEYLGVASNLWLFGIMAFSLSLLTLESKLALARHDYRSSFLLLLTLIFLGIGIAISHSGIRAIIISVSISFLLGWIMVLALNWMHRYKYLAAQKSNNNIYDQV